MQRKTVKTLWTPVTAAALLLWGALAMPAPADGVKSYQIPSVIKKLTEKYGGPALSERASSTPVVTQKDPLGHLVAWERTHYPQAWVASTFYDYRTTSIYRRNAGLHLGYDIAMPYGTAVSAGWAGIVTDIIPWTDTEYGVSVTDASGVTVTYGHIKPLVSIGQRVEEGTIIARIQYDHVDVKMRDASGQYVPFGENSKANSVTAMTSAAPVVDRRALLTAWLVAKTAADQSDEELFMKENASQKLLIEKRTAERKVEALEGTLKELARPENSALVSRKKMEELKAELSGARSSLQKAQSHGKASTSQLQQQAKTNRANLKAFESWAKSQGLTWKDVEELVALTVSKDSNLTETVVKEKKTKTTAIGLSLADLASKREEGRKQLARLEDLFASGGMSLQDITDERLRQELLEEEYALKKSRQK